MSSSGRRRRIGLLGGTFDPPHLGHLIVAEEARVELSLDEIRFLVAGDPWMKREVSDAADRIRMVELAVEGHPPFVVDPRETERDGPTYTADTLEELRDEIPGADWWFLLGADAATHLEKWKRAEDALAMATFVVVDRPGSPARVTLPDGTSLLRVEVPLIGISSTDLRERVARGRSIRFQVPEPVRRYVEQHALYESGG